MKTIIQGYIISIIIETTDMYNKSYKNGMVIEI